MAKVLEMLFDTAQGKKFTISVDEPRADLTSLEVDTGMQSLLASNVFYADGANPLYPLTRHVLWNAT